MPTKGKIMENIKEYVLGLCKEVKAAQRTLASLNTDKKNDALKRIAAALTENADLIISENIKDIKASEGIIPKTMVDRLTLNYDRIAAISESLIQVASLPDPVGQGSVTVRPNGLKITKTSVPIGVVGMIYEARPNVTVDAAALCIKSGNGAVLRGGKEAVNTNRALIKVMKDALAQSAVPSNVIALIDDVTREGTNALMSMKGYVDVLIPRGGKGLIKAVVENATVPVIETGAGNCHIYIDEFADLDKSVAVAINAKLSRPSVCNAVETMLVHKAVAKDFLPMFTEKAKSHALEIRGCTETCKLLPDAIAVTEADYETEFDDYILAIRVVEGLDEAIEHIRKYTTGHSEAIMTESYANATRFCRELDAAAVYVNASTRFTDGGEFGFGAEIGISTQKLHTRGPMGLAELTTVKYIVEGDGQVR